MWEIPPSANWLGAPLKVWAELPLAQNFWVLLKILSCHDLLLEKLNFWVILLDNRLIRDIFGRKDIELSIKLLFSLHMIQFNLYD